MESSFLLLSEGTPNSTLEHSTTMFTPHVMHGQMKILIRGNIPILLNNEAVTSLKNLCCERLKISTKDC